MFNPRKLFHVRRSISYSVHREENRETIDPDNLESLIAISRRDSIVFRHNIVGYMKEELPLRAHVQVRCTKIFPLY